MILFSAIVTAFIKQSVTIPPEGSNCLLASKIFIILRLSGVRWISLFNNGIKNNLLITISSSSSNSKVMYDLKKYTNKLSRSLKINSSISGFFGNEEDIYKNIDDIISDKNFEKIVLHPLFLFDGFLYQSTKKKFQLKYRKKILIIPPILKNKETFKMFVRKINNQILLFK